MDVDLTTEPTGTDPAGKPVYLREIWPTPQEVESTVRAAVSTEQYRNEYTEPSKGGAPCNPMAVPAGDLYTRHRHATYLKLPPYFDTIPPPPPPPAPTRLPPV